MFYIYPAVFDKEDDYYNVCFPDLPGCLTYGCGQEQALLLAEDALATWIGLGEQNISTNLPAPSDIVSLPAPVNGFVSLVHAQFHLPAEVGLEVEDEDAA
ncbi:MAG: type II toxin-antitoxin system HicB family antitoxin [Allobaculum sp.]|uniref:type II toxin-antitoxin system HicB family antitoxin n=1 Tax=Allobaculum sp. TaxID=1872463 RepID=UPI003999B0F1